MDTRWQCQCGVLKAKSIRLLCDTTNSPALYVVFSLRGTNHLTSECCNQTLFGWVEECWGGFVCFVNVQVAIATAPFTLLRYLDNWPEWLTNGVRAVKRQTELVCEARLDKQPKRLTHTHTHTHAHTHTHHWSLI